MLATESRLDVLIDNAGAIFPDRTIGPDGIEVTLATLVVGPFTLIRDLLPLLNSTAADLLEHDKLVTQLISLERRTSRGGKDSIDHPPGGHDDVANAVAGALVVAYKNPSVTNFRKPIVMPNFGVV